MNAHTTTDTLIQFLHDRFATARITSAVVAVSGGVDSATSLAITTRALGASRVYPLLLPYGQLNHQGVVDGMLAIRACDIPQENVHSTDIQPMVDAIAVYDPDMSPERKGNMMARVRMIVVFDQAKKRNALVVGTENKTEHYLGYYTRFGDEASDIEPLRHLYKSEVYTLARYLGVPELILTKAPTAGLWAGQTDEGEFGFTYKEADVILSELIDRQTPVSALVEKGFSPHVVAAVVERMQQNSFKQEVPYVLSL